MQYFNTGVKTMMTLALLDMFKNKYHLEPSYEQELQAIILLPWTPKIFYGIITDTFPIFGSRKRSYIILMGLMQCAAALCIALIPFETAEPVAILGTLIFLAGAFMDVVVDGLMVQQQRLDPAKGSEDLQSLSWAMYGVGGVVGSGAGGLATQYGYSEYVFYSLGAIGLIVALTGFLMSSRLEASAEFIVNMTLCERIKLNFREIKKGFKVREFHRAVIFFMLLGALVPSFTDYFYYYLIDISGITPF